jgi:hypothetical protein
MIEALRGLGYSAPTAIADIVDNSVAASAGRVSIGFAWNGAASRMTILDDGVGMSASELDRAMRLGDRSPLDARAPTDLGRFGLGLKTASFSQCRRLTVASRRDGVVSCLRWDLDVLASSVDDGWHLLEVPFDTLVGPPVPWSGPDTGTLVIWEALDGMVTPGFGEQDFLDVADAVERHLAMVFHRYLEGTHPRLRLDINGRPVGPWDPFMARHPATWSSPIVRLRSESGTVEVQSHVLPHRDHLTADEQETAAGPEGWTAQQGFHVYRNQRLLVAGSWLGLGQGRSWTKEEAHRLARIRLDIPNSADAAWRIDIRKSSARPPVTLRSPLTRLAEDARERARRVFAHRGQPIGFRDTQPISQAWRTEHFVGGMRYRIDQNHPAVRGVLDDAGGISAQVKAMLRVIEETVPVQRIWLDTTEGRETPRVGFSEAAPTEVLTVLEPLYGSLMRKGLTPAAARDRLLHTEPFNGWPDLVAALPDTLPEPE